MMVICWTELGDLKREMKTGVMAVGIRTRCLGNKEQVDRKGKEGKKDLLEMQELGKTGILNKEKLDKWNWNGAESWHS